MKDEAKTEEQLLDELAELRRQIATLESIDIERRRSEEALRQSEERYRLFLPKPFRSRSGGADANTGEVIEFNRRWYEYTGQTPEEAKGTGGWMSCTLTTQR